MSCFIVSDRHIVSLAIETALNRDFPRGFDVEIAVDTANKLLRANEAAFAERYGDSPNEDARQEARALLDVDTLHTFTSEDILAIDAVRDPVTLLKACDCYEYQAGDWGGYDGSEASRLIYMVRASAIRRLPGYDKAPWGID